MPQKRACVARGIWPFSRTARGCLGSGACSGGLCSELHRCISALRRRHRPRLRHGRPAGARKRGAPRGGRLQHARDQDGGVKQQGGDGEGADQGKAPCCAPYRCSSARARWDINQSQLRGLVAACKWWEAPHVPRSGPGKAPCQNGDGGMPHRFLPPHRAHNMGMRTLRRPERSSLVKHM